MSTLSRQGDWCRITGNTQVIEIFDPNIIAVEESPHRPRARRQYVPAAQLALAAAALKDNEAIRHLREAFEIRDPDCQFFFSKHLPFAAPLYAHPRFRVLLVH